MHPLQLTSLAELDAALAQSAALPVFLFKHSTRCPISHAAYREFLTFAEQHAGDEVAFATLDLIRYRDVSNAIAERLGIVHQSPQVILVHGGTAIWSTSHYSITGDNLAAALANRG